MAPIAMLVVSGVSTDLTRMAATPLHVILGAQQRLAQRGRHCTSTMSCRSQLFSVAAVGAAAAYLRTPTPYPAPLRALRPIDSQNDTGHFAKSYAPDLVLHNSKCMRPRYAVTNCFSTPSAGGANSTLRQGTQSQLSSHLASILRAQRCLTALADDGRPRPWNDDSRYLRFAAMRSGLDAVRDGKNQCRPPVRVSIVPCVMRKRHVCGEGCQKSKRWQRGTAVGSL